MVSVVFEGRYVSECERGRSKERREERKGKKLVDMGNKDASCTAFK